MKSIGISYFNALFGRKDVNAMRVGIFRNVRGGAARFAPYVRLGCDDIELIGLPCEAALDTIETVKKAKCEGLIYYSDHKEDEPFYKALAESGVKYVVTCSAGYDHLNIEAMKRYGIKGANVPRYSPNAISEHTVMIVLALLRKLRTQILRIEHGNFTTTGLQGRELRNMVVGIVGAGRIGYTTIQCLSGFHPKAILAYDIYENHDVRQYASYVPLDELYAKADVIIFHCAYTKENYHMVNDEAIQAMKDGVVLVNSARGPLFDTHAMLRGLHSGKIGALGIDVIEGEGALRKSSGAQKDVASDIRKLLSYENVIFTAHTAFYTDQADYNLCETTIQNLRQYARTGSCDNELIRE